MPEQQEGVQTETAAVEVKKNDLTPIGERVIGTVDPHTLSREQFSQAPDLLFHGALSEFEFDQDTDYRKFSFTNSATIGNGFYATNDKENAALYSRIRKSYERSPSAPVVIEVLPFQAKVLDLRASSNPGINAPVPSGLAQEYRTYINNYYASRFPEGYTPDFSTRPLPKDSTDFMSLNSYRSALNKLFKEGKPIELRSMLSSDGSPGKSENAAPYFTGFMLDKGFDGLVYNEGGDSVDQKHTTSYVFYNLENVGTYDSWHV